MIYVFNFFVLLFSFFTSLFKMMMSFFSYYFSFVLACFYIFIYFISMFNLFYAFIYILFIFLIHIFYNFFMQYLFLPGSAQSKTIEDRKKAAGQSIGSSQCAVKDTGWGLSRGCSSLTANGKRLAHARWLMLV